ncbi:heavy metal-associated isoprenylated plant protein 16-like [Miscanthus floridulus]|uniref:heavy metal-associated isoprenylated plant protein 16-like n=1 Tax=Miscanthus floridulus TaxID=154761 RepID=UPI003458A115
MSKQKTVIRLGVPNSKNRSKAMQLASKSVGVTSVATAGEDRLEVVGESVDIPCLINRLRKKVCRADIVLVEEVKDKKKEEEEKKKKEEEAKKKKAEEDKKKVEEAKKKAEEELKKLWGACPPPYYGGYYRGPPPPPPPPFVCEEQPAAGCHIM